MVSQKLLLELKEIIEQDNGIKLTMAEVTEVAMTLTGFAETAMQIEAKKNSLVGLGITKVNFNVKTNNNDKNSIF